MRGYEVVTSDDRAVGEVVDVQNGFLIVESGHVRKARHPVPREFVHPVDEAAKAFVTVPRRVLMDAPKVDEDGVFDRDEACRYFGLSES
jgi:ribosomal 30S subunit maturation factor RimM